MFVEALKIELRLTGKGGSHEVPGGNVKSCALELRPHGFEARITFWSDYAEKDELFDWFVKPDLIEARLTLEPVARPDGEAKIELRGLVADKALVETAVSGVKNEPVLLREYTVRVLDPAALSWRQHRPLELRAQATMKELITSHLPHGMTIDCTLDDAERRRPLVCIATDEHTSFYDVVTGYAERAGGTFYYDYFAGTYRLARERKSHHGRARLHRLDVAAMRVELPETLRHGARVLNGHSEAAHITEVEAPAEVLPGIARDRLVRTSRGSDVDDCTKIEKARLRPAYAELELELARLGDAALMPGAQARLDDDVFSSALFANGAVFRVCSLSLSASVARGGAAERNDGASRSYEVTARARWESEADQRPRLPSRPSAPGPLFVEGKIVSDAGGAHDRTFMAREDRESGLSHYVVHVPLWNQRIEVPFQPQFLPGHVFAPAFKDSRVLLALHFDHAEIVQFLDWGPDVRLPGESQGNHLLFGKNATSQTSLKHVYVDDKPVFSLSRVTGGEEERLQLEDGAVVLELK